MAGAAGVINVKAIDMLICARSAYAIAHIRRKEEVVCVFVRRARCMKPVQGSYGNVTRGMLRYSAARRGSGALPPVKNGPCLSALVRGGGRAEGVLYGEGRASEAVCSGGYETG